MINISGTFHVQIGAFSCPNEAHKLAASLVQQGYTKSNPAPILQRNGHSLWTVRVDSCANIRQARTVRTALLEQHPDVKIKAVIK